MAVIDNLVVRATCRGREIGTQLVARARIEIGDAARVYVVSMADRTIAAKVSKKDDFASTRDERHGTNTPEGNLEEIALTLELAERPEGMRPDGSIRAALDSVLEPDAVLLPLWALLVVAPAVK